MLTLNKLNSLTIKTAAGDYTVTPVSPATTGDIYLALLPCSESNFVFIANANFTVGNLGSTGNFMAFPTNVSLTAGKFYRNLPITLTEKTLPTGAALRDLSTGSITANNGEVIWQSNGVATGKTITIADGANITLAGVNISATGSAGIICSGTATINLEGTNSVTTAVEKLPAILAGGSGKTLTIQGSGSLTATGGKYGAGIGTGSKESGYGTCGNITINGGNVTAQGGSSAAGIGSGNNGTCGNITIIGGKVTAQGGSSAAGIGSGYYGKFTSINITRGITRVIAWRTNEEDNSPIGKGSNDKGSGSVTVDDVANWAGTETTHLNFSATTTNKIWTLTHK